MKRMSMIQRKVAAAPVHTRMITSTLARPSSPEVGHNTLTFSLQDVLNSLVFL
jgi:hypothetical protein